MVHEVVIERAGPDLAPRIHGLLVACGRDMAARGFRNWDPPPATPERIAHEARVHTVLVATAPDDALVGSVTLRSEPTHSYGEDERTGAVAWADPGARAMYMNRLAVDPAWQRSGQGGRLLEAAEEEAARAAAAALRCDVLEQNSELVEWYVRRGYLPRGRRRHGGKDFVVLEKRLPGASAQ